MRNRRTAAFPRQTRVLILIENLPLDRDSRVRRQCRSLVDAGHRVTVVCPRRTMRRPDPPADGVRLITYPRRRDASAGWEYLLEYGYSLIATAALVLWVAITTGFDVIQACSPPDLLGFVAAPYRLLGKKYVFDHHDLSPEIFRARFDDRRAVPGLLLGVEKQVVRLADAVISANGSMKDRVARRSGAPAEKFTVVRNGPNLADVPRETAPRTDLKRGRRWLCCWHGVMGHEDGVDLAVLAASTLVGEFERRDVSFALIGDGEARPALEDLTAQLGLTDWIHFPGWLGPVELSAYLATADVGLSPDPPSEHLDWMTPIKVLEYMAYGVPVIGFERAELVETVGGGGVFVTDESPRELAAEIDRLLDDPDRLADLGDRGRRRLEEGLAWDHQGRRYVALLEDLLTTDGGT